MTILISRGEDGHRREYVALFSELLFEVGDRATVVRSGFVNALSPQPILFMMIEDSPLDYFATAILRAIFGRRTVGLLFRPIECLQPRSIRHRIKRVLLRFVRGMPRVASIAILPEMVEPRLKEIVRCTIFDPQLWDLSDHQAHGQSSATDTDLQRILNAANGRNILMALGRQDGTKGFDYLTRLWRSNQSLRKTWLFVAAGEIDRASRAEADHFERDGGLLIDRFIDFDELINLYRAATMIWCCYPPGYDQSSGILGRAVQLGVPAIVRKGSYIERFGTRFGHPIVSLPWDKPELAVPLINPGVRSARVSREAIAEMRRASTKVVLSSLGFDSR